MEQYSIIGVAGDTVFVEGELLGDQLIAMFPKISFVKDMRCRPTSFPGAHVRFHAAYSLHFPSSSCSLRGYQCDF
jgi:hypothetical protein